MKKQIVSDKAPSAIGPYSQGVSIGDLVFTSGQLPMNLNGVIETEDVTEQTHIALSNLKHVLESAGSKMGNVIKTTVFIIDMNDFGKINEVYSKYFEGIYPSRSCVQVARLPKDAKVEIEAIAYRE